MEAPKPRTRFGKTGLCRYLVARLSKVKEILRQDREEKQKREARLNDEQTLPVEGHVTLTVEPAPPEEEIVDQPVEVPPEPCQSNDILRVDSATSASTTSKREHVNKYGKKTVCWTSIGTRTVRTILEICTWTMMISTVALEKDPEH